MGNEVSTPDFVSPCKQFWSIEGKLMIRFDDGITGIQGGGIARLGSVTTSGGGIATICLGEELRIGRCSAHLQD